ncbi:hypothetical protein [Bartonella queenslandensis]|uniref:hypothetical protein n=1 Tax=Bartonella queenslandensis TaxID=481138 RepID=UPI0012EABA24|nr:hypothetical protein [Bartonella queenslandensis]
MKLQKELKVAKIRKKCIFMVKIREGFENLEKTFEVSLKKINPKVQLTSKSAQNDPKSKKDFHLLVIICF